MKLVHIAWFAFMLAVLTLGDMVTRAQISKLVEQVEHLTACSCKE